MRSLRTFSSLQAAATTTAFFRQHRWLTTATIASTSSFSSSARRHTFTGTSPTATNATTTATSEKGEDHHRGTTHRSIEQDIDEGYGDCVPPSHHHHKNTIASHPTSEHLAAAEENLEPTNVFSTGACDENLDLNAVLVEESSVPGILIIRLNNGPVNVLSLPVMRVLQYYLELAASSVETRLGVNGDHGLAVIRARPNPWLQRATVKTYVGEEDPHQTHKDLVELFANVRGLVLGSALKNVFCAGMDLDQLLKVGEGYERQHQKGFTNEANEPPYYASFMTYWSEFQSLWLTFQTLPIPIVAAINGDAAAAGCILGMCCDYRVMAIGSNPAEVTDTHPRRMYKIGIAAARSGFWVPEFLFETMIFTVATKRAAEELLAQGILLHSEEAVSAKYQLVDALSESNDTVLADAVNMAARWAGLTPTTVLTSMTIPSLELRWDIIPFQRTFWLIKYDSRAHLVSLIDTKEKRLEDVSFFIHILRSPHVYHHLRDFRDTLKHHHHKTLVIGHDQ